MKKLIAITALVLTAGAASASTQFDYDRFGVDVNSLSAAEKLAVDNAIHGGNTDSEIQAFVRSIMNNG